MAFKKYFARFKNANKLNLCCYSTIVGTFCWHTNWAVYSKIICLLVLIVLFVGFVFLTNCFSVGQSTDIKSSVILAFKKDLRKAELLDEKQITQRYMIDLQGSRLSFFGCWLLVKSKNDCQTIFIAKSQMPQKQYRHLCRLLIWHMTHETST